MICIVGACPSIVHPGCTMIFVVLHVLVKLAVCLQAAVAILIAGKAAWPTLRQLPSKAIAILFRSLYFQTPRARISASVSTLPSPKHLHIYERSFMRFGWSVTS